jgi:hypothetical protein
MQDCRHPFIPTLEWVEKEESQRLMPKPKTASSENYSARSIGNANVTSISTGIKSSEEKSAPSDILATTNAPIAATVEPEGINKTDNELKPAPRTPPVSESAQSSLSAPTKKKKKVSISTVSDMAPLALLVLPVLPAPPAPSPIKVPTSAVTPDYP